MTEQGERRINQPQCDPTGGKNAALPTAGGGGREARVTRAGLHHELARSLGFSIAPWVFRLHAIPQHQPVRAQGAPEQRRAGSREGPTTAFWGALNGN